MVRLENESMLCGHRLWSLSDAIRQKRFASSHFIRAIITSQSGLTILLCLKEIKNLFVYITLKMKALLFVVTYGV